MSQDPHQTQDRLLDAAERLFSQRGFEDVSVRELATLADVNVAAVNYHFGGKENLFRQVVLRRFTAQRDRTLAALDGLLADTGGRPSIDQVIEILVQQHLHGVLVDEGSAGFLAFMIREMHGGHQRASVTFFRELIAPTFMAFSRAMTAARPGLAQSDLNWIIASIVGQIHHFVMRRLKFDQLADEPESRDIMKRAFPALALSLPEFLQQVTTHITRFSTAAIDGMYPEVSA